MQDIKIEGIDRNRGQDRGPGEPPNNSGSRTLPSAVSTLGSTSLVSTHSQHTGVQSSPAQFHAGALDPQVERWIAELNGAHQCGVAWKIQIGVLLLKAKAELAHGQWIAMFESRKLRFGLRTAEMLMEIARHPSFQDSNNFANLPSCWTTLHVLSKLSSEMLQSAIATGAVHPELSLAQARNLVRRAQAEGQAPKQEQAANNFDVGRERTHLLRYLHRQSARWPFEYREELASLLEAMTIELRAPGKET